ncbi:hypothetical protein HHL11_18790 [Ramlibacter sp. G-1-2-2]|uniref:Uncharacterized protein n=1 Tax=Ramlibacter agri TaxID=2728837 RepID=A0A848H7B0_9BURK|nr:hypothetical protein [Ramlibacter agri]NML45802.1 hypothetical protein [Ramlibacter agri]
MAFFRQVARVVAMALFCVCLATCGGGGGGGGGGGSETSGGAASPGGGTPAANTFDAVSVSLVSPKSIQRQYEQMEGSEDIKVYVQGTGDIQQLNGKTLYAIVEDPDFITGGNAYVELGTQSVPGSNALIHLSAGRTDKSGHFQGELKLHACLDPRCATELAGSPLRVPYDITVLPGLTLSPQEISLTVPFGELPALQSVEASLPVNRSEWSAYPNLIYQSLVPPHEMQLVTADTAPDKGRVTFQLLPAPPGNYQEVIAVTALVPTAQPRLFASQRQFITVTYTVTPNPAVDYVFYPAAVTFTVPAGSASERQLRVETYNEGISSGGRAPGVEYLSNPPEAAGHPFVHRWWSDSVGYAIPCGYPTGSSEQTCLPPGIYTARVKVSYMKGAEEIIAYWPVTLNITP